MDEFENKNNIEDLDDIYTPEKTKSEFIDDTHEETQQHNNTENYNYNFSAPIPPVPNQPVVNNYQSYNQPVQNSYAYPQNQYGQQQYNYQQYPNQYGYPQNQQAPQNYQQGYNQYPMNNYNQAVNNYQQVNQGYNQYPPQANPPVYRPIPKKKMNRGVKTFLIILAVVFSISVVATVVYYIDALGDNNVNYDEFLNDFGFSSEYDDYYGDYNDDYNDEESSSSAEEDEYLSVDGVETPDIEIPDDVANIVLTEIPDTEELEPEEVYNKVIVSTVSIETTVTYTDGSSASGSGTGIILTEDGFILTNSHVINDTKSCEVIVITSDDVEHEAIVVGYDKATDLAVLKIDGDGYVPAEFADSDDVQMGQWVMAIGSPAGLTGSVTRGIISGTNRSIYSSDTENSMTYIQTDAAINPGNSGGPLVNMYGQVVGINTAKIVEEYFEGVGLAIPSTAAVEIANQLMQDGYVSDRVRLGITAVEISSTDAMMYGIPSGIMIYEFADETSFANTDAETGDIIVSIDGEDVVDLDTMTQLLLAYSPGDQAEILLFRMYDDGSSEEITITITFIADDGATQG